jgi:hypothetical protein
MRSAHKNVTGKPLGKIQHSRFRRNNNININIKEIVCEGVD